MLDYEAMATGDRLVTVAEYAYALADDRQRLLALVGASEGTWRTFVSTATYQLHKNATRNGQGSRHPPPLVDLTEGLLRLGYALRFVDELAGEQPHGKAS